MGYQPAKTTEVSLFPFLSVLCAMIGVMMLLLVGVLSSRVMESEASNPHADDGIWPTDASDHEVQAIRLVPDPSLQVAKRPKMVEVTAGHLVVHPEEQEYAVSDDATAAPALKSFFDRLNASRRSEYLLLLVHPTGVKEYQSLRSYLAQQRYRFDVGVEPFAESWKLSPQVPEEAPAVQPLGAEP